MDEHYETINRIQQPPTRGNYINFKDALVEHGKSAYKYRSFQEYVLAGEYKLGRRLNNLEVKFLFDVAKTPRGEKQTWNFTEGHPRGRYVTERPINNIYSSKEMPDSDNIFDDRHKNKERAPRLDLRHKYKGVPMDRRDPDLAHDEYEKDRDLYPESNKSRDNHSDKDVSSGFNSNSYFLQTDIVNEQRFRASLGGNQMPRVQVLNSSVGEVKDLLSNVKDNPPIRVAIERLVKSGYAPKVAREILADAEEVGAVRIARRRVFAEATADNIPEKLIPVTKFESQEFGADLEEGAMETNNEVHPWDSEVGRKLEQGDMSPDLDTMVSARIAKKIDKIASDLERIEQRLDDVASVERSASPSIETIEADLDKLGYSVEKLEAALQQADGVQARRNRRATEEHLTPPSSGSPNADYSHELQEYEDYPADPGNRKLLVDTANEHHYQRNSRRRKANYGSEVMNVEMGDEPTYRERARQINQNDKRVIQHIRESRRRRLEARRRRMENA